MTPEPVHNYGINNPEESDYQRQHQQYRPKQVVKATVYQPKEEMAPYQPRYGEIAHEKRRPAAQIDAEAQPARPNR